MLLPPLRPDQRDILCHPAKTKVVACGRRYGKTYMAGVYALTAADLGGAVAWVVPVYKNARAPWRFAEAAVSPAGARVRVNRTERVIEFPSGGRLSVYSADNDVALRGEAFDVVIVDEAARVSEETYSDVLMPTLADRDGTMLLISTPHGRNWFWREWVRGQTDGKEAASWTAPTSANPMPTIQKAALQAKEVLSERTYRQEWLAEFLADGGSVIRFVDEAVRHDMPTAPDRQHTYVAGIDWALSVDYTVCSVVDATSGACVAQDRFNGVEYAMQRERIAAMCKFWDVRVVTAEQNAMGKPNNDELRRMGLPVRDFTTSNSTKADIIESLAAAFEHRAITIPNSPQLIAELQALEATRTANGSVRYAAPDGMHDDCAISLALAWVATGQRVEYGPNIWR